MEKKTNVWMWIVIAILGGVFCAGAWEFVTSKQQSISRDTPLVSTSAQMQSGDATKPLKTEIVKRIKGNRNSMIYHLPGCASYNRIDDKNIVWFATSEEAEAAGFRMAKNC